jgi:predicted nucleic acid-binding protein
MKIIDSSSWIHYLRGSDKAVQQRVEDLLLHDKAAWCEIIAAELWSGVRNETDRRRISLLERGARNLAITPDVWRKTFVLASKCRESGLSIPITDIIIAACGVQYEVEIETCDKHFALIRPVSEKIFSR